MFELIGAGLGLLGGLAGGGNEQTQTRQMDPRLDKYVYGDDSTSGLLADSNSIYQKQIQTGGLNDMQRQGMGMQYQYLTSPQYLQGAQSLYNQGASLLGSGVAGNPFTNGSYRRGGMQQMRPQTGSRSFGSLGMPQTQMPAQQLGFQFQPVQMSQPDYSVQPKDAPAFSESDFERMLMDYLQRQAAADNRFGSGDGYGGGMGGGDSSGDGPSGEA